ncbi:hypothetical protein ACTRXD_14530 [Nitrospira sp. T9]|uniref:hypothetical protein n=1 Tax=unclassified Nitrospira TaxID=2652172 RepID=UPI003F9B62DC
MRNTIMTIPLPTALVGLGLYWLCKSSSESSVGTLRSDGTQSFPWRKQGDGHPPMEEQVKERLHDAKDTVEGHLTEWKDQTRQQAYEWKKETEQKMENVKGYLTEKGAVARGELTQLLDNYPLAVGAGMVALGVAVAAVIPVSRKEDQWMGSSREKMVESVKTTVRSTAEDVTQKAGTIAEKVLQNTEHPVS